MVPIVLFALAALGGGVLAVMRLRGRPTLPLGLAVVHGLLAAAGLIALIVAVVGRGLAAQTSLVLFIVAALGGSVLFAFQLRGKPLPVGLVLVHGLLAIVAFVLLLVKVTGGA
jgi:hypothetical protein